MSYNPEDDGRFLSPLRAHINHHPEGDPGAIGFPQGDTPGEDVSLIHTGDSAPDATLEGEIVTAHGIEATHPELETVESPHIPGLDQAEPITEDTSTIQRPKGKRGRPNRVPELFGKKQSDAVEATSTQDETDTDPTIALQRPADLFTGGPKKDHVANLVIPVAQTHSAPEVTDPTVATSPSLIHPEAAEIDGELQGDAFEIAPGRIQGDTQPLRAALEFARRHRRAVRVVGGFIIGSATAAAAVWANHK